MSARSTKSRILAEYGRLASGALTLVALAYLLIAEYSSGILAGLVALIFVGYIALRTLVFFENDRFTPKRRRVSLTWALAGIDETTQEFDPRPVRVYFVLLTILLTGTTVRPFFAWVF